MKKVAVLFLFICFFQINAQQQAITLDGKKVILNKDGTWKYVNENSNKMKFTENNLNNKEKTNSSGIQKLSENEIKEFLEVHNKERKSLNIPILEWSEDLANYANEWGSELAKAGCKFQHRQNNHYGENLAMSSADDFYLKDAALMWLEEKKDFKKGGKYSSKTGHYTQMIWKNTKKVGACKYFCNGRFIVIANYDPPGNYIDESPY